MFTALRRSYHIFRESLSVLAKDTELLIFPLLSGIFTIIALAGMVFGGYITGFFQRWAAAGDHSLQGNLLGYAALFVWYFVSWFIVLFRSQEWCSAATSPASSSDGPRPATIRSRAICSDTPRFSCGTS